jgi:hypothetical protein
MSRNADCFISRIIYSCKRERNDVFCYQHRQKARRKKTGPKAGFQISRPKPIDITWLVLQQRPKQRSKQRQQPTRQPKQRSKRQQQQRQQLERLVRLRQQLELLVRLQLQERCRRLELGSRWFLLFCCMRSEQQPSGRRSAGIFSWFFLN